MGLVEVICGVIATIITTNFVCDDPYLPIVVRPKPDDLLHPCYDVLHPQDKDLKLEVGRALN